MHLTTSTTDNTTSMLDSTVGGCCLSPHGCLKSSVLHARKPGLYKLVTEHSHKASIACSIACQE